VLGGDIDRRPAGILQLAPDSLHEWSSTFDHRKFGGIVTVSVSISQKMRQAPSRPGTSRPPTPAARRQIRWERDGQRLDITENPASTE
jgi:hypothetical protein